MRIRIAQQGWAAVQAAKNLEEVKAGIRLPWVELDGVRLTDIASVEFSAGADEFGQARMTIELLGPVEIVYVGPDGEPLGHGVEMTPGQAIAMGRFDHDAMHERVPGMPEDRP